MMHAGEDGEVDGVVRGGSAAEGGLGLPVQHLKNVHTTLNQPSGHLFASLMNFRKKLGRGNLRTPPSHANLLPVCVWHFCRRRQRGPEAGRAGTTCRIRSCTVVVAIQNYSYLAAAQVSLLAWGTEDERHHPRRTWVTLSPRSASLPPPPRLSLPDAEEGCVIDSICVAPERMVIVRQTLSDWRGENYFLLLHRSPQPACFDQLSQIHI
jgi:hypothetical protein